MPVSQIDHSGRVIIILILMT